jgi:ATP-dependent RNA helicase DeaD
MQLPSHEDIADRRIARFKQMITDTLESQDVAFFENLIGDYQRDHDTGLSEIAAALAFLVQRERPLLPEKHEIEEHHETAPGKRPPARTKRMNLPMERYRIEVGRQHGAQPKNIVGAIANEAGLESRYIGQITLHDTFSTVDLPEDMPKEIFEHLRQVWVCGRQLRISLLSDFDRSMNHKKSRKTIHGK